MGEADPDQTEDDEDSVDEEEENESHPTTEAEDEEELVFRENLLLSILRKHFSYSLLVLSVIAVPLGILAAYGTSGFRLAFGMLDKILHQESGMSSAIQTTLIMIAGGFLFGWVLRCLKWDRFRTPAHVIVAVADRDGRIPLKDGIITAIADALSLGMGAPVGRYGPAVHLGATLGSAIAHQLRLGKPSVKILLGCGVAAAISASFNAPIAGVIFAHEVIIGHFRLRAFAPITLASVAAVAIVRFHDFEYAALKLIDHQRMLNLTDYPLYLLIGIVAAGVSVVYMIGINRVSLLADQARIPRWAQPATGAAIAGLIAIFGVPEIIGLGDDTIQKMLEQNSTDLLFGVSALFVLGLGKLVGSVACLGLRFPGGSFSPAIFIGSTLGAIAGLTIPVLDYQIAVLVGMGAMVSSVVGAPLATILIVFELTENYQAATAVMVGVVASNAVVTRFYSRSLFHRQIMLWGIDITKSEEQKILQSKSVSEVMHNDYIAVKPDRSVADLRRIVDHGYRGEVFVIDDDRALVGSLSLTTLVISEENQTAAEISETPKIVLKESDSAWSGFVSLEDFEGMSVPVVDNEEDRKLIGAVYPSDFVSAYRKAIEQSRDS